MNKVILTGRIVNDIEKKSTLGGFDNQHAYVKNCIAVKRKFKNKDTNEYPTDFINFTVFGQTAENFSVIVAKGDEVLIEGRWSVNKYINKVGESEVFNSVDVESFELIRKYRPVDGKEAKRIEINDEDLPF